MLPLNLAIRCWRDKHVVPEFVMRMKDGVFKLHGFEDSRSSLYIEDAVRATMELAECEAAADQIVNVGSGEAIQIPDLGK